MTQTEILVILIILFGAFIRTVFGFGDALAAMPLLTLISFDLKTSTALIGVTGFLVAIPAAFKYRTSINWAVIRRMVIGSILGIPVGIALVKYSSAATVARVLGGFLIIYGLYSFFNSFRVRKVSTQLDSNWWDYFFGLISGLLGSAYNSHGVAIAIYGTLKNWTADEFRGILQAHFMCVGVIVVSSQAVSGFWNMEVVKILLISIPLLLILIPFANWVSKKINSVQMVKYVYAMLTLFGVMLIIKG
ncbi:sulfite exporter TauE/SafE family protein [Companilactobacillus ginsenosidimutans]|uniref:sulfite exporter TauE/SafE family protein n=1 Tax=Companilactobacillus ginsenosidimutans TaxID=1007676 RepID=UPI000A0351FF|nr:sulfite exporter TauE/SafE family protein [Companilactobacillus ginsenosidimutans]